MPSRKLTGHCHRCNHKNHLRATYCNHCGAKLSHDGDESYDSPQKLYADVAHPINSECRELIQNAVIREFEAELSRCKQPGYRSRYDDDFDVDGLVDETSAAPRKKSEAVPPRPHFLERPEEKAPQRNDDDSFGAGVF
jgi:stage V sporulation protein G